MTQAQENAGKARKARKVYQGRVKSNKMDKTITVIVERLVKHPVYEKFIHRQPCFSMIG